MEAGTPGTEASSGGHCSGWCAYHWNAFLLSLLPPTNIVCEGYVFTYVCHSFCSQGGVPDQQTPPWTQGRHTPRQTPPLGQTPPRQTSPRADTPLDRHPPGRHPPGQTPPLGIHHPGLSTPLGLSTPPGIKYTPGLSTPPPYTVNARAVRILLECKLVPGIFLPLPDPLRSL